jgi:predicted transcriptional regulator
LNSLQRANYFWRHFNAQLAHKKGLSEEERKEIRRQIEEKYNPLRTKEISDILGLAKRTTINWINHLINKNLVEPTSESRNDPNCKYKIRG